MDRYLVTGCAGFIASKVADLLLEAGHEVILQIGRLIGREPIIEYRDAHPADVPATWASVAKARELLGWQSEVSVEEELRRCVEWYRENREIAREIALWE